MGKGYVIMVSGNHFVEQVADARVTAGMATTLFLSTTFACLSIIGCKKAEPAPVSEKVPTATARHSVAVALLGDTTRIELLEQHAEAFAIATRDNGKEIYVAATIDNCHVNITTGKRDQVASQVLACSTADLAVIAVDARNGPMPIHREHILFARQMHVPSIMVVLTHCDAIDDPELLELEELEMRELLSAYGWAGDVATVSFSPEHMRLEHVPKAVRGANAIARLFPLTVQRPPSPDEVVTSRCHVELYVLAEKEAFPVKTTGISPGSYAMLFGKTMVKAKVHGSPRIAPGANGSAMIALDPPIDTYVGQRCAILSADRIIAVGVVTRIQPKSLSDNW